jgi:glycosyltransferase involved in cell wall biosynthesis
VQPVTVSIVTRTKNRPILLRRALRTILGQRFKDWQLVVVNDGGDPRIVDKLVRERQGEFPDRIKVIHNGQSRGMEAASNIGLRASNGEYCIIHDDDDSWHPEFLSETVNFMRAKTIHASIQGVVTQSWTIEEVINKEEVQITRKHLFNPGLKHLSLFQLAASNQFPPISFLYRRRVHDEIGYYREDLPVLGDWEFNLRFMKKYNIGVITRPLANYHHRMTQKSGNYGNTVVAGKDKHHFFDCLIRNEFLRRDLESGSLGMGFLVNIAKNECEIQMDLQRALAKSRRNVFRYLKDRIYNSSVRLGLIDK